MNDRLSLDRGNHYSDIDNFKKVHEDRQRKQLVDFLRSKTAKMSRKIVEACRIELKDRFDAVINMFQ